MADDNQMHPCICCYFGDSIGVKTFDKISEKDLLDILTNESRGKKQVVGNRLKAQNDRILRLLFSLGDGFENLNDRRLSFNNLALDRIRKGLDGSGNLGKSPISYFSFKVWEKLFSS